MDTIGPLPAAPAPQPPDRSPIPDALYEVIETLAAIERPAGSEGEQRAAGWIAERLQAAGCEAHVEKEQFLDGYASVLGRLAAVGVVAGAAALGERTRRLGGAAAALAAAAIADDVSNGPRLFRRATSSSRPTWNVVATAGEAASDRTLVVLAHHDAAQTGLIFDDRAQVWVGDRFPGLLERIDTSLPLWWALLGGPGLVTAGAARGSRRMAAGGMLASLIGTAVFADIARRPVCPGANDNLTAVAVLVALAERLRQEPIDDLRVLLVSCGAEEVIQGGIYGFAARHFPLLDRERTWFLNLETVGSPRLILLEGEGSLVMEDYCDRSFRDLIVRAANRAGTPIRRGMRSRNPTDAVIPSRAGYPTATITSVDRYKSLSNYHKMSDTPENVDLRTVTAALNVSDAVARELATTPWFGR